MRISHQLHALYVLLIAASVMLGASASAQTTLRADWTNLGKGNLQEVTSGESLTVGPNSVTITTRVNRDGDANDANFVPFYSTGMLSYYTGQVSSQTGVLFYNMDHSVFDAGDYFETTYTLATAATNLAFTLGNVDAFLSDPFFQDGVIIEYDVGTGTWLNLRNLAGATTTGTAVGTTTIGGQAGWHGIAYSGGITSTTGDIRVNFGALSVKRVRVRYRFGQSAPTLNPSGNWQYMSMSDMTWRQVTPTSDLRVTKTVSNAAPAPGATITYDLSVTNSGPDAASNVVVNDLLPTGVSFVSTNGSYNATTGDWTVGTIANGATRNLTITAVVDAPAGVTIVNTAEVTASSTYDPDSTPGNGQTGEDDYASASFTVQGTRTAGVPPTLFCPVGTTLFDWDSPTVTWTPGSVNNSYAVANIGTIGWNIVTNGVWVTDPAFGGASPALSQANTGGRITPGNSLHQYLDFANRSQSATTTITLPTGVAGAQFTIFDIDFAANDFADKLTVEGRYEGATVIPILTNGVVNYVVGNVAVGDGASDGTSADGNVEVTFDEPVDTIIITYGNASTAPANPDGQAIAIDDIELCSPDTTIEVEKTSVVLSDEANGTTDPKAIPGAIVEYCILVRNTGISTATDLVATDTLPANITYRPGTLLTGADCATASVSEDDDATGADETDPNGASFSAGTVVGTATSLGPNASYAVKFEALID